MIQLSESLQSAPPAQHYMIVVVMVPISHLKQCLAVIDMKQGVLESRGVLPHTQYLVNGDTTYITYTGDDSRMIRLLVGVGQHVICYQLPQQTNILVERVYWRIRQNIHLYNIHDQITLTYVNSTLHQTKTVGGIQYSMLKDYQKTMQTLQPLKNGLSLKQTLQLLVLYAEHEQLSDQDFYTDKMNYIELTKLTNRQKQTRRLMGKVSSGSRLTSTDLQSKNLTQQGVIKLQTHQRKMQMLEQIARSERRAVAQDRKYQNIKNMPIEHIQFQHLMVANTATVEYWVMHMLGNLQKAYNQITNAKDTRTKNLFAQLYQSYNTKLQQLAAYTSSDPHYSRKVHKMQKQLQWFYGYHQRYLKRGLLSPLQYAFNQLVYLTRKKSVLIQKVAIILMVLLLIELLSSNSFFTVTLTLVLGIFYLKQ